MKLKVTTVGNSTGVILPKELLEKLRIGKGDTLYVTETSRGVEHGYGITNNHLFSKLKKALKIHNLFLNIFQHIIQHHPNNIRLTSISSPRRQNR